MSLMNAAMIAAKLLSDSSEKAEVKKIFNGVIKRLGMNPCPEAIGYLYERYYDRGRCARASD